jgi:hypothetical protein
MYIDIVDQNYWNNIYNDKSLGTAITNAANNNHLSSRVNSSQNSSITINIQQGGHETNLQKVYCQFSLETISHLDKCMIWFIAKKFNSHNVPIKGEQVEQFVLINSLG